MQKTYGWIVWFIATIFVVYAFSLNTATAVFSEVIKNSLYASDLGVSLAIGTFILGFAIMQVPVGYWLDKFNARWVVSTGVLLLAIGNIFTALSNNLIFFGLANFLQGMGASFAFIATAVLISQWFKESYFPILFGLSQTLACLFAGIIHYYFTLVLATHSWNDIYFTLGIFGFSLFVLTIIIVKSPINNKSDEPISLLNAVSLTVKDPQILLCSIAAGTSFGVLLAYAGFWYTRVQAYYSIENLESVIISGMIFAGMGIGQPLFGLISNHIKSRKMVIHITLCLGTMFLLLGLYLPKFNINTLLIMNIISFLIGFFLSGSILFYTMVSEKATKIIRGVAISVINTFVFLSNALMLFVPYLFVTETSKEFFTYLWILPFLVILSLLLLYFIKETFPKNFIS